MKLRYDKNSHKNYNIDLSDIIDNEIEKQKVLDFSADIKTGIHNFIIFQKYTLFRWPAWACECLKKKAAYYNHISPPVLLNKTINQWNSITNYISSDELQVDPTGMLSTSYSSWAVEFWVNISGVLYRSQDDIDNVIIRQNHFTSIIDVIWENNLFTVTQRIFAARSVVDEGIVEVSVNLKTSSKNCELVMSTRPYNNSRLGGIKSIEYHKSSGIISVDGRKHIATGSDPSFVTTGNGKKGDIDLTDDKNSFNINCSNSMAASALGFNLKKGDNNFYFRFSLNRGGSLNPANYDYKKLQDEFSEYSRLQVTSGMNIKFSDTVLKKWFYSSKISVMNFAASDLIGSEKGSYNFRLLYYIIFGYNRMGYFNESKKLIESVLNIYKLNDKEVYFSDIINSCYLVNSFVDYFTHTRDIDFVQLNYINRLKNIVDHIYKACLKIKSLNDIKINTIAPLLLKLPQLYDVILISHTFHRASYLARCLGIFGDEKKFIKESERFEKIVLSNLSDYDKRKSLNDFYYYDIFSGFPFKLPNLKPDDINLISDKIFTLFNGNGLYNKSLGIDIIGSIVYANNLVLNKDERAFEVLDGIIKLGGNNCILPEYINPATGMGCYGEGSSKIASSLFFALVRNLIYIDIDDRLEIFPLPRDEWFKPGKEIAVESSPSRFGSINFRMKSTTNEVQFYFEDLPKYIPPDISINLPFNTKVIHGEDFMVKKRIKNSYIINGWPSQLRFIRKS